MLTSKDLPGSDDEKEEGITRWLRFKGHFTVIRRVMRSRASGGFSKGRPWKADKTKLQISVFLLVAIFRFKKKINFVKIPVNTSRYLPSL